MFQKATLRPSCEGLRSHGLQRWQKPLRGRESVGEVGCELSVDLALLGFVESSSHGGVGPLEAGGGVSVGTDKEANQSISNLLLAARKNSENLSDFVESGLGPSLGPAIGVIAKLLKDLQIGSLARLPSIKV